MSSKKEKTLYPWAYERVYAEKLTAILKQTEKKICDFVSFDDQSAGFDKRFNAFLETLRSGYGQQFAHDLAARAIDEVNRFVTLQIQKTIDRHDKKLVRDALGDLSAEEKVFMNAKLAENVSLIKSIGDEYLNKVQDAVYRGWSGGMQTKDIIVQIQGAASEGGITSVSERRAKLIARDQVGSLAGQLTKFKSESAGINYFTWETAADERVRAAHRAIDGKIFSWSEGWGGVFPGEPIQCRCVATAVFDDEAAEAEDSDFWDPEADDVVLPGKKNGSPNPPKVEPVAVVKPDMPYYGNLANKPDWLKASGAKMDLPTQQKGAEISTGKVEGLPVLGVAQNEVSSVNPFTRIDDSQEIARRFKAEFGEFLRNQGIKPTKEAMMKIDDRNHPYSDLHAKFTKHLLDKAGFLKSFPKLNQIYELNEIDSALLEVRKQNDYPEKFRNLFFRTVNNAEALNTDAQGMVDRYLAGEFDISGAGSSFHGRAVYFAKNYHNSRTYSRYHMNGYIENYGTDGVIVMKIDPGAKVLLQDSPEVMKIRSSFVEMLKEMKYNESVIKAFGSSDRGLEVFAVLAGYDAIYEQSSGYVMILNRKVTEVVASGVI